MQFCSKLMVRHKYVFCQNLHAHQEFLAGDGCNQWEMPSFHLVCILQGFASLGWAGASFV